MDRVELQQMRVHLRIAHGIVDPGDLRPAFQQRLQRQLPDPAQPVDGINGHARALVIHAPMSSTAFCNDIRSSASNGSDTKAWMRLRSAP
jgi:hypothetical protein